MTDRKTPPFPDDIKASAQRIWLAGLGALSMAEEEGGKLFRNLVEKGSSFEARGKERAADVRDKVEDVAREARARASEVGSDVRGRAEGAAERVKAEAESLFSGIEAKIDKAVSGALGRAGVPSREEIAVLSTRIEELTRLVEQLKSAKS